MSEHQEIVYLNYVPDELIRHFAESFLDNLKECGECSIELQKILCADTINEESFLALGDRLQKAEKALCSDFDNLTDYGYEVQVDEDLWDRNPDGTIRYQIRIKASEKSLN